MQGPQFSAIFVAKETFHITKWVLWKDKMTETTEKLRYAVEAALTAVKYGQSVQEAMDRLQPVFADFESIHASIIARKSIDNARHLAYVSAEEARATQLFSLSWRGGGSKQVTGWEALTKEIGLMISSIRVNLSRGKGSFDLRRPNPFTGEPKDILTVLRLDELDNTEKPRRGRPPKARILTDMDLDFDNPYDNYSPKKPNSARNNKRKTPAPKPSGDDASS